MNSKKKYKKNSTYSKVQLIESSTNLNNNEVGKVKYRRNKDADEIIEYINLVYLFLKAPFTRFVYHQVIHLILNYKA